MASTTWVGGDSGNETDWNTGANWSTGSIPTTSAHVVIANTGHNCALDTTRTIGSLTIQASATIVGGGNRLIIQSEGDAAGGTEHYALKNDGIVSGNLHLEFTYAGETAADFTGSSGNFNDIKLNAASVDLNQVGVATFDSLIIVANATYDAGNDGLTISGDVSCTGIFLGNSTTTISHGSLTIASGGTYTATSGTTTITDDTSDDYLIKNAGTFTHNSGTVVFDSANGTLITFGGDYLYNLTITNAGGGCRWKDNALIAGDLIIGAGESFRPEHDANTLTVTGDVTINGSSAYLGPLYPQYVGAHTFGSLTINSGGEYKASYTTTTITTGNATYGAEGNFALVGGGTFTHNNGTLVFDSVGQRLPKGGTFYNVTLTGSQTTGGLYLYSSVLSPAGIMPDGTTGANYISILGTLTITDDELRPYNVDKMYVHNLIIGDGTGSANSAKFDMAEADGFDGTVFVDNVTIHSDGQLLFGDGDETSATVGSSALNIYGAFRNLGGNVTIE
jgi:hypothetical protein